MVRIPMLLLAAGLAATLTAGPLVPAGSTAPCCAEFHETKTRIAHLDNPVSRTERARVRVRVTSDDPDHDIVGQISLYLDGKLTAHRLLRGSQDDGVRAFRLPRLSPGVHLVRAKFHGNIDASASQSGKVRLRVTR